ncbi:MAG: PAS domain S-box protein, partial [Myxococcales bacterium]|nr:PAS domain S-box protein [Myxococcales bacterium]
MSTRPKPAEALIDELRASAERFRTIFENAPVMIDQFDADGRCLLWNRECERQLGYTQAEVAAAPDPLALFYPDDEMRSRVLDAITRADGEFREYRVRAKDQSERLQLWAD